MADAGLKRNVPGQEQLEPSTMEYTFSRPSNAEALCSRYPVTDIRRAAPLKEVAAVSVPVNKPTGGYREYIIIYPLHIYFLGFSSQIPPPPPLSLYLVLKLHVFFPVTICNQILIIPQSSKMTRSLL